MNQAELERLALLSEECGEVVKIIGKIIRHGYESFNPFDEGETTNRDLLKSELGDVLFAMRLMSANHDVDETIIQAYSNHKAVRIGKYLHEEHTYPQPYNITPALADAISREQQGD
jgi:NTP pyrophosphatase (non-canonical NTP hydrolase)